MNEFLSDNPLIAILFCIAIAASAMIGNGAVYSNQKQISWGKPLVFVPLAICLFYGDPIFLFLDMFPAFIFFILVFDMGIATQKLYLAHIIIGGMAALITYIGHVEDGSPAYTVLAIVLACIRLGEIWTIGEAE